VLRLRRTARL